MSKKLNVGSLEISLLEKVNDSELLIEINAFGFKEQYLLDEKLISQLYVTILTHDATTSNPTSQQEIDLLKSISDFRIKADGQWRAVTRNKFNFGSTSMESGSVIMQISEQHKDNKASVYIALPQKSIDFQHIEKIQNACGDIMDALGFELEQKEEPVFGSFFQKLNFLLKSEKTSEEIAQGYDKAKQALELKYISLPSAEATEKLAGATAQLITSLQGLDEAAIRVGPILVLKYNKDGKTGIITETLSPQLSKLFDENPQLLKNPTMVYDMLGTIQNNPTLFKESDGVSSQQILE